MDHLQYHACNTESDLALGLVGRVWEREYRCRVQRCIIAICTRLAVSCELCMHSLVPTISLCETSSSRCCGRYFSTLDKAYAISRRWLRALILEHGHKNIRGTVRLTRAGLLPSFPPFSHGDDVQSFASFPIPRLKGASLFVMGTSPIVG